jgi:mRNA-degrading endonuclease RelE of RelBE toxin-antitoxin system
MAYRVVWDRKARRDLAAIWVAATDKNAVTQTQATADRWLATDPYSYGQTVAEGLWAITVLPLRICFEVDDARSLVKVTDVNRVA